MTFNADNYVEITPDGNIGVRDSVDTEYFHEQRYYLGENWKKDGFTPALARQLAKRINELADKAEKDAAPRVPANWPPQVGDVWAEIRDDGSEGFQFYALERDTLQAKLRYSGGGFETSRWTHERLLKSSYGPKLVLKYRPEN